MIIGRVAGQIFMTINHQAYDARTLLIIDRLTPEGEPSGGYLIAVDTVGAGAGETVLILDEGNSARQVLADANAPVRAVVVGIIDDLTVLAS